MAVPSAVEKLTDDVPLRSPVRVTVNKKFVEHSYYRADNYEVNAIVGLPYGMDARQHTIGATVGRQISKNVRLKLQYGYFHYRDETSGGHNNYDAHAVFSSLAFRF